MFLNVGLIFEVFAHYQDHLEQSFFRFQNPPPPSQISAYATADNIISFNLTAKVAASSSSLGIDVDLIEASLALSIRKLHETLPQVL